MGDKGGGAVIMILPREQERAGTVTVFKGI